MPLPSPILDNRSYQQLRDELIRRIPVYNREWTDHNPSDPGITLIELFAFLGENLLFRFNQIPETTKLAFLRLLQIPLRSAATARGIATFTYDYKGEPKKRSNEPIPQGAELKAGQLSFETLTEVTVWPIGVRAVAKATSSVPDPGEAPEVHEFITRTLDAMGELQQGDQPAFYENKVVAVDGQADAVDFDRTVDGILWIAVLTSEKDPEVKRKIHQALAGGLLNLAFVPDSEAPAPDQIPACLGAKAVALEPSVEWQISQVKRLDQDESPTYKKVELIGDTTRGVSQEGVLRLKLPRKPEDFGLFEVEDPDAKGTRSLPPALDDDSEEKLLFWLRAFRPDGSRFGKVRFVGVNATQVVHAKKARPEFLGVGNGQPKQQFRLVYRPVLEGSLVLEVEELDGWREWQAVDGFHASDSDDRHYVLDCESGTVSFGNGMQGMAPQVGWRIRAREYRYGGGAEGNLQPEGISKLGELPPRLDERGTVITVPPSSVKVTNPLRTYGGGPSETIEAALDRIPGELRRRDRAVTAGDFQELALATPGAKVGRAECLPRFHPPTRKTDAAGIVTVVVWPKDDPKHPNAPVPDRNLLRGVCAWLDRRRLVTTELYVIPPRYRKVAVAVGLRVKPGYGVEAVRRWVELVVRQYLSPLPPYGPSGTGWPLGRRIHGPELEAAALQVEGVEFLEDLKVAGWNEHTSVWVPGTVALQMDEVPELAEITVIEGPLVIEPGQAVGLPPNPEVPVPVPILKEEC